MWVLTNDFFRFNFATEKFSIKRTKMKQKISKFLFIMIFVLTWIYPPNGRFPEQTGSPAPGQPPIIVVIPGGGK